MIKDKIKVVIVDDNTRFQEAVNEVLSNDPDITVVGRGETAGDAIYLTDHFHPDIILLDLRMPGGGFTSARVISQVYPNTRIIVVTVSEEEKDMITANHMGIHGYFLKGGTGDQLLDAIRRVYNGEYLDNPNKPTLSTPKS